MISSRIFANILIIITIFLAPYWIYVPLMFIAAIIFPLFWEGLFYTALVDTIYGKGVSIFPPEFSTLSLAMLGLLLVLLPLLERIRQ